MTSEEINGLTDRWIQFWEKRESDKKILDEYLDEMLSPAYECDPEILWLFVQNTYKRDLPERLVAILAAGPVEELLAYHGAQFIDRIEQEARRNTDFMHLLGGVWRNAITKEVWGRIEKCRGDVW
jgi:hypothetical protein